MVKPANFVHTIKQERDALKRWNFGISSELTENYTKAISLAIMNVVLDRVASDIDVRLWPADEDASPSRLVIDVWDGLWFSVPLSSLVGELIAEAHGWHGDSLLDMAADLRRFADAIEAAAGE